MRRTRRTSSTGRGQNIDPADKVLLLEIIKEPRHRSILNNRNTTGFVNKQKIRTWAKIAHEFNAVARIKKTAIQLKSVYRNELTMIRKTMASNPAVQTGLNPLLSDNDVHRSLSSLYSAPDRTDNNSKELTSEDEDIKVDIDEIASINGKFLTDMESPSQPRQLKPVTAVEEAKIKMFESYAKAAETKSMRQQELFTKKIELVNQKILYYQVKRENLEHDLSIDSG